MFRDRLAWASGAIVVALLLTHPVWAEHDIPPAAPFEPREGDVLLFLTDDLTEQVDFPQFLESFLITRFPQRDFRTFITGLYDRETDKVAARFQEIAALRPTSVIVIPSLIDLEDGSLDANGFPLALNNLQELHRRICALPAEPVYISPLTVDLRSSAVVPPESWDYLKATRAYGSVWLQEFAAASSARFVDLEGPLSNLNRLLRTNDAEFTFNPDGRHPHAAGQLAVAAAILEQWGLERPLSAIHIALDNENLSAVAEGGRIYNIHLENTGTLSFFWQADALPWAATTEFQSVAELLQTPQRFNHETLQITGLAERRYLLLIDDQPIGKFLAAELADGISLEQLATPQAEQGKTVAEAHLERMNSLILPAQKLARLISEQQEILQEAKPLSSDAAIVARRKAAEARLAELVEERRRLDAAAEESWNQLRTDSQPRPRRFVIRPLPTVQVQGRVYVAGMPISGAAVELHGMQGLAATGTTDAMGFFELTPKTPGEIPTGDAWLVVLAQMVLPKFVSLESSGNRMLLRTGVNEIELHFEELLSGE